LGIECVSDVLKSGRLSEFGHVERKEEKEGATKLGSRGLKRI